MKKLLILATLLFSVNAFSSETVTVKSCNDGDTCKIVSKSGRIKTLRLANIDAPEFAHFGWGMQPFAVESRIAITNLCVGKQAVFTRLKKETYGRQYGTLVCDGKDVSTEMVSSGLAWRYKYSRDKNILALSEKAKSEKVGIWSSENPVDPWLWRKNRMH